MQMIQFYLLLPQASYSKVINFSLTCAFWVVGGGGGQQGLNREAMFSHRVI